MGMPVAWKMANQSGLLTYLSEQRALLPMSDNLMGPCVTDCDRALHHQVRRSLRGTGYAALQQIDCRVENGIVELSGDVPSFYFKQIAQAVLLALKQVQRVENRLRVPRSP
jgi:osmotically-inducible protein OsmY